MSLQLGGIEVNAFNIRVFESVNFNAFNAPNNRGKRIPLKFLMNVVSDFGFFFFAFRSCHEKAGRKNGRLPSLHRKAVKKKFFLGY